MEDFASGRYDTTKVLLNPNDIFSYEKLLGSGSFGDVYKIRGKLTGRPYALKVLKQVEPAILQSEIGSLQRISHYPQCNPHMACYYDSFLFEKDERFFYGILSEFIDGIPLYEYVRKVQMNPKGVRDFARWLIAVVNNLHNAGFIHRDIKPENIMIQTNGEPKLIDFGITCSTRENVNVCRGESTGTPYFMAPELLNGTVLQDIPRYSKSSDAFAIGATLYNISTFTYPYLPDAQGVINFTIPATIVTGDPCLDQVITGLLNPYADNRLTLDQALVIIDQCK